MCNRVLLLFGKLPQWNLHVNCHVNRTRFQTGLSSLRVSCKRALIISSYLGQKAIWQCAKLFYFGKQTYDLLFFAFNKSIFSLNIALQVLFLSTEITNFLKFFLLQLRISAVRHKKPRFWEQFFLVSWFVLFPL